MTWDEERFTSAELTFSREGSIATFYTPGKPDPVQVSLIGEELQLLPRRSGGHRRILGALGEDLGDVADLDA